LDRLREARAIRITDPSLGVGHMVRTAFLIALDLPELGDPETYLDASVTHAAAGGLHERSSMCYRAFVHARSGDARAVSELIDDAYATAVQRRISSLLVDCVVAAAELVAAIRGHDHTFLLVHHRRRRLRERLPAVAPPERRLAVTELYRVVRERLEAVSAGVSDGQVSRGVGR
jgi:hypothetical protein